MSLPTSGCASWYEVMSDSSVMVLPVPVGICGARGCGRGVVLVRRLLACDLPNAS